MPLERVILMVIQLIDQFMVIRLIDCFMCCSHFYEPLAQCHEKLSTQDRLIQCLPPQAPLKCTPISCFCDYTNCPVVHLGQ